MVEGAKIDRDPILNPIHRRPLVAKLEKALIEFSAFCVKCIRIPAPSNHIFCNVFIVLVLKHLNGYANSVESDSSHELSAKIYISALTYIRTYVVAEE